MRVTIPACDQHSGHLNNLITIEIKDLCPKCGAKRGIVQWKGLSFDGSRRLEVDCWRNECDHVDKYSEVRQEKINE